MQTRAELRAKVAKYLRDAKGQKWSSAELDAVLAQAWRLLVDAILDRPAGRDRLRRVQGPRPLVGQVGAYPLPADCIAPERVEVRPETALLATLTGGAPGPLVALTAVSAGSFGLFVDDRFYRVTGVNLVGAGSLAAVAERLQTAVRALTGGAETVTYQAGAFRFGGYGSIRPLALAGEGTDISGPSHLNGRSGTVSVTSSSPGWTPLAEGRSGNLPHSSLLVAPSLAELSGGGGGGLTIARWSLHPGGAFLSVEPAPAATGGLYRLWYYAEPSWPAGDSGRIRDLPDGIDDAAAYLAAALGLDEQVEEQLPIGHFGSLARLTLDGWLGGRANRVKRSRYYINRVD